MLTGHLQGTSTADVSTHKCVKLIKTAGSAEKPELLGGQHGLGRKKGLWSCWVTSICVEGIRGLLVGNQNLEESGARLCVWGEGVGGCLVQCWRISRWINGSYGTCPLDFGNGATPGVPIHGSSARVVLVPLHCSKGRIGQKLTLHLQQHLPHRQQSLRVT